MGKAAEKAQKTGATISVERVGANLAAEIGGVDLSQTLDDTTVQAIDDALVENELLIFHDQDITAEQQMAFGRRFGELTVHPFAPSDDDVSELIVFDNNADNPPWGTDVWHSDETFREEPPMATMLRALIVPKVGGDTVFASMSAAYEGLSDHMQGFISGLEAVHDFKPFRKLFSGDAEGRRNIRFFEDKYPPAVHPVVREHPVSGRKVLFVSPQFTIGIKGMDERESQALLEILFHQALIPEYQFRHHWRPNTLVFWDNRSVQHYAVHDFYPQRRKMERVTIKGDRPFGAYKPVDPAALARHKVKGAEGKAEHGGHKPLREFERELAKLK